MHVIVSFESLFCSQTFEIYAEIYVLHGIRLLSCLVGIEYMESWRSYNVSITMFDSNSVNSQHFLFLGQVTITLVGSLAKNITVLILSSRLGYQFALPRSCRSRSILESFVSG